MIKMNEELLPKTGTNEFTAQLKPGSRIVTRNMSPENLHCDGEITASQAARKARLFRGAYKDLIKAGFTPTEKLWCLG